MPWLAELKLLLTITKFSFISCCQCMMTSKEPNRKLSAGRAGCYYDCAYSTLWVFSGYQIFFIGNFLTPTEGSRIGRLRKPRELWNLAHKYMVRQNKKWSRNQEQHSTMKTTANMLGYQISFIGIFLIATEGEYFVLPCRTFFGLLYDRRKRIPVPEYLENFRNYSNKKVPNILVLICPLKSNLDFGTTLVSTFGQLRSCSCRHAMRRERKRS